MHAKVYFNALCLYVRTKNGRRKINPMIFSRNCLVFPTGFTLQYWHCSFALEIIGGLFFRSYLPYGLRCSRVLTKLYLGQLCFL